MEVDDDLYALLSEQRRELSAAISSDSDHDLAFKLQMEEALNASLTSQPSSSSCNSKRQRFDVPDEGDVGIAKLLAEEIDKFERERSDREHVDVEMKRVRDELSRTIHDRAFAREVLAVPEVEWRNSGDYYNKPYENESEKISSEDFRVYCKGLVSEEMVGSEKKVLAGIGVAICDSSGEIVVFKMRKPLLLEEMSGEVAEVKALIEGLNAAVTLGLKRITVFCDDVETYQFVTGKWVAKLGNIAILADELTLLQRKFTRCLPHLIEKKNVQFAVGLARDAITAQVTWPGESSGNIKTTETCIICLEDRAKSQMLLVDGCKHQYCSSCLKQHSQAKLSQGMLPRCPHEGCKSELKFEYCRKFLPREALDLMSQRIKEATVPVTEKVYCPYPRCSTLMSRTEVCAINNVGGSRCTNCHGLFCINCKVPWHSNMSCSHYKNLHPYPSSEEVKLKTLATKKQWRQCEKCNNMIELKEGCNHISCRCGHEFCYTCGAEWKNKQATCKCAIWDEHRIVYPGRNRR